MNYIKVVLLIFLLTSIKSLGQNKEYIVTNANDTIYGKITRKTNLTDTKVIFKIKDEQGKKNKIDPANVKLIRSFKGLDGDAYITTVYDRWFIKKIIDGRIKVYQEVNGLSIYVAKDDSRIMFTDIGFPFSRKKAHAQIRPLLKDQLGLLNVFDTMEGSQKNIFLIIEKYNEVSK